MKVAVITISDRASQGIYEDLSGQTIQSILKENLTPSCNQSSNIEITRIIVPDEKEQILGAFEKSKSADFIITTGGTGISERDITPEVTKQYCDRELPGIAETLRAESYRETLNAMLSRGYAGIKNKTIIVNFPGSVKAVTLCTKILIPIMDHSIKMLHNEGH